MGIKTLPMTMTAALMASEKPPHHMGIKTEYALHGFQNLLSSEKPPHHMGIKTISHPSKMR